MTKKVEDYRKHAEECRKMARSAITKEEQHQLLVMAETWEQLASNREQTLKRRASEQD